jgi:hypothetical protein
MELIFEELLQYDLEPIEFKNLETNKFYLIYKKYYRIEYFFYNNSYRHYFDNLYFKINYPTFNAKIILDIYYNFCINYQNNPNIQNI